MLILSGDGFQVSALRRFTMRLKLCPARLLPRGDRGSRLRLFGLVFGDCDADVLPSPNLGCETLLRSKLLRAELRRDLSLRVGDAISAACDSSAALIRAISESLRAI